MLSSSVALPAPVTVASAADDDPVMLALPSDAELASDAALVTVDEPAPVSGSLDMGLHVSFAGMLTYKSAQQLRDVAKEIPLDRLLVETDCPYLSPVPHRGKRNEPAYVARTAEQVARLWGTTADEVGEITSENAERFFRLPTV